MPTRRFRLPRNKKGDILRYLLRRDQSRNPLLIRRHASFFLFSLMNQIHLSLRSTKIPFKFGASSLCGGGALSTKNQ
ncbi:MAG: hypothetical protein A2W09_08360 [Deltaproteobacteria bacterium RBG_16_50_11]|nr:MAG: hypothetical protein A2W09_08360 [Deltaproteobacteria bacterium RBG_16_50_11]